MKEKELNFIVTYGTQTFTFKQGSKAFIFHTGIYNHIDKKYGYIRRYFRLFTALRAIPRNGISYQKRT